MRLLSANHFLRFAIAKLRFIFEMNKFYFLSLKFDKNIVILFDSQIIRISEHLKTIVN